MIWIGANILKVYIVVISTTYKIPGRINGNVTYINCFKPFAPSILADSYKLSGILSIEVNKTTSDIPLPVMASLKISAHNAKFGFPNQSNPWISKIDNI